MIIEQMYTGCLAQGAYFIESDGEVAIIDPLREVDQYIEKAAAAKASIKYVFETHFHADFVSGHVDLANQTGAVIVFGPHANPGFGAHIAMDNEEFSVGKLTIIVLHTPGHTMESVCYLLKDEEGKNCALFSGDTLFIGDVGRPDLAQETAGISQNILAGLLYDSLREKIMPLSNDIIVYPAHGAGSACGKNISKQTSDTLGNQKEANYALAADLSKEDFIREVTEGLTPPPQYFPANVSLNKGGYGSFEMVYNKGTQPIEIEVFASILSAGRLIVLDTRSPEDFARGFVPGSLNIGIDGSFAPWVGAIVTDLSSKILIIADEGREGEVVTRLARVGFDNSIGYLKGGFDAWKATGRPWDTVNSISVDVFASMEEHSAIVLDVRKRSEYKSGHLEGALNIPLDYYHEEVEELDREKEYFIHCAGGYRSMIFCSLLKARGFERVWDIQGGFKAIKDSRKFLLEDAF
ncbi:MBL fold metallo-hydrolase [Desertivirga arenae]|uniref:MBL fold metallo-hydrolase n=1 Tax=Desertivirga arenae TaxID=2810309 RepID=UPI001A96AF3E|nr:MBL fold metallo-hydrolase [Pedobacter sp. SYSU D00823]